MFKLLKPSPRIYVLITLTLTRIYVLITMTLTRIYV